MLQTTIDQDLPINTCGSDRKRKRHLRKLLPSEY